MAAALTTPAMAAIFAPETHVGQMLRFEAALARAEAQGGIIPSAAADRIGDCCRVERFDVGVLFEEARFAGTLAIPLVRQLTEQVGEEYGRYVHWGATSQDAIDTALVLQMRDGLDLLIAELLRLCATCAGLAERHRHTVMAGRTLLQQAVPITFGLKAARWLAMTERQVRELRARRTGSLALQFGGAAGTLAALGPAGVSVATRLGAELQLTAPEMPWHTERDRIAAIAGALGIAAGAMAKIAGDVVLLAQTEIGEAAEGMAPGKGGSSAMPHKRNPTDAVASLAASRLALGIVPVVFSAMAQEHERAAGSWQAEVVAIPDLFRYTAGAVGRLGDALGGLEIDAERMRGNVSLDGGALMAESLTMGLALHLGRPAAQRIVKEVAERATAQRRTLHAVALADSRVGAVLGEAKVTEVLDPAGYLGSADVFIDRALAQYAALREST
jgi:3-carboxy-cis,cis-muconate cycloisomerase